MSFITRCPACATMFKVVADQLKVSQGWVRCGTCSEVFDASTHFYDPASSVSTPSSSAARTSDSSGVVDELQDGDGDTMQTDHVMRINAATTVDIDLPIADELQRPPATTAEIDAEPLALGGDSGEADPLNDDFLSVSFVRKARREAFWRRAGVRASLVVSAMFLSLLLGVQFTVRHKDRLAALEPRFVPALLQLCRPLACSLNPVRRIESVVVDSASFSKVDSKRFRLAFMLKNMGDVPLEVPSLELTLSDSQDKPLLRRVLSPAQFGLPPSRLLPVRGEANGVVNLTVADSGKREDAVSATTVAGYRVLVFYP